MNFKMGIRNWESVSRESLLHRRSGTLGNRHLARIASATTLRLVLALAGTLAMASPISAAPLYTAVQVSDVGTGNTIQLGNTSRNVATDEDGNIFVAYHGTDGVRIARSTDRGQTFSPTIQLSAVNAEVEVAVDQAGVVYASWVESGSAKLSRSIDSGVSFSAAATVGAVPCGSVHIATDSPYVYLLDRCGSVLWRNGASGVGSFTTTTVEPSRVFADIHVDRLSGEVFTVSDNSTLRVNRSVDHGASFVALGTPGGAITYSTGALAVVPSGRFWFSSGSATAAYRIDVDSLAQTALVFGNNTISQGRSLAAAEVNLVDGYVSGGAVKYRVSQDLGATFGAEVTVAPSASGLSVAINAAYQDIVAAYESGGQVYVNVYDGEVLLTCGDGILDSGEQCDDDNNTGGDGCSALCQIETCWGCTGAPSTCGLLPSGAACPDDGDLCTSDQCDGAGTCVHASAVDCDALNQCYPSGTFTCAPDSGTCQACPAGYTVGGGGCQKTYSIDASLLDNLNTSCSATIRYNDCSGAFGFHWTDAGDGSVGAVIGADLQVEAGLSCSGTNRNVLLNGNPVGSYAPAGTCSCSSAQAPRVLNAIDVSSYVKGGANAVLTDAPGFCEGLSAGGGGAFALVTVTYAAPSVAPLPDGTDCDDGTFCNGADTCAAGACATHAGDPCTGPNGDTNCAESCNEPSDSCTAPDPGGTLCRAASGDCDVEETCDGVNAACPVDDKQPDGTGCDDGSVCTQSDSCQSGVCIGADPLNCDDGEGCTADSCDPIDGCVNDDSPAMECLTSGKSIILIKENATDNSKNKLLWKWIKGDALTQMDLADPITSAGYSLCIYAGTTDTLIADMAIPPGSSWKELGSKGYKFKGTSPDGLTIGLLKGGVDGKSKALAKGKGEALPIPMLPLEYPVTVQLKKSGSPLCLESKFTSLDEKKNDEKQFKGKVQ